MRLATPLPAICQPVLQYAQPTGTRSRCPVPSAGPPVTRCRRRVVWTSTATGRPHRGHPITDARGGSLMARSTDAATARLIGAVTERLIEATSPRPNSSNTWPL